MERTVIQLYKRLSDTGGVQRVFFLIQNAGRAFFRI